MKTANFNLHLFVFEANKRQHLMSESDSVSTLHGKVWN